jgi:hypothetical protein
MRYCPGNRMQTPDTLKAGLARADVRDAAKAFRKWANDGATLTATRPASTRFFLYGSHVVEQLPSNRSRAERGSSPLWDYQPIPNAMCSGCGVVIVVLWLLLSS